MGLAGTPRLAARLATPFLIPLFSFLSQPSMVASITGSPLVSAIQ